MFIMPSFKKSLIVGQFQGNYLKKKKNSKSVVNVHPIVSCLPFLPLGHKHASVEETVDASEHQKETRDGRPGSP